ncbi:conserved hypothetical protein [Xenorhabdus nematophila str. Websteri]|nr:conserved hypothetical protein [Xenorhabdus nematophila str. Websteri]CEF31121.1 conserved hypothetical protein [Xenorhabdus nematophila str. Websteri]
MLDSNGEVLTYKLVTVFWRNEDDKKISISYIDSYGSEYFRLLK